MSVVVMGRVSRVTEREAGNPGNTWTERTLVVEDWGQTTYVVVGKELQEAGVPSVGEDVAIVCSIRAYASPKSSTGAGYGLTGLRRHGSEPAAKGVRAAS